MTGRFPVAVEPESSVAKWSRRQAQLTIRLRAKKMKDMKRLFKGQEDVQSLPTRAVVLCWKDSLTRCNVPSSHACLWEGAFLWALVLELVGSKLHLESEASSFGLSQLLGRSQCKNIKKRLDANPKHP